MCFLGHNCINCFFFFQAEDGIRDYKVTGVQTCALPISSAPAPPWQTTARTGAYSRCHSWAAPACPPAAPWLRHPGRSEEHTSELQSPCNLVCRLLLEKKKIILLIIFGVQTLTGNHISVVHAETAVTSLI